MTKPTAEYDVIVLGDHPCTHLAALLLCGKRALRVLHVAIPTDRTPDRAVLVNPQLFRLDKSFEAMRKRVPQTPVHGLRFLSDDGSTRGEHQAPAPIASVARVADLAAAARELAAAAKVPFVEPRMLDVRRSDPHGVEVSVDGKATRAIALVVGGDLPSRDKRTLGISESWGSDCVRRHCYAELPPGPRGGGGMGGPNGARVASMSLDLGGTLRWAWMLSTLDARHLIVEQPATCGPDAPPRVLRAWADVLAAHGVVEPGCMEGATVRTADVPAAGALSRDGVADRTLLIGPAGGFYSACGEDAFPNCWSAIHATDALAKALREPVLQDALDAYRACWRTTLGIYLQGPQQNLRFLLPMIYRNPAMTSRLAEAILVGKNVVR